MAVNKVDYYGETLIDISDTTATAADVASGKTLYLKDGTKATGTLSPSSSKNIQVYSGYDEIHAGSYTASDVTLKVTKAGTYKCSWICMRNTTSGTNGTQLYKNGSAVGSAHTSGWVRNYFLYCTETLTLAANDVLVVRGRSRNTSYYMVIGNLIIEEQ